MPNEGVGTRLEAAIKAAGKSKSGFAEEMERRGIRGAQYRTLVNYLTGKTIPTMAYLEAAADVLGVSVLYLAHGPEQGHALPARTLKTGRATEAPRDERDIEAGFGATISHEWAGWPLALELLRSVRLLHFIFHPRGKVGQETWERRIAKQVGTALGDPIRAVGLNPDNLPESEREAYLNLMTPLLLQVVEERHRLLKETLKGEG